MVTAYSYLRFSTPEQMKGDSFRRQTEASDRYVAENGLVLDSSLNMHDYGLSAFDRSNVTKGALGGFIRAVTDGRVTPGSVLIVESLDRLSRDKVMDALHQFISIVNAGVEIVTLSDNQRYSKESLGENPMQLLISITIMARAHEESATKSKRVSAAWQNKLKQVITDGKLLTKKTPLWIKVVDGKLELIPERADVVRRVFALAREGTGTHTIIKILNDEVPAWNKAGAWQQSYLQKMLTNIAVYGAIQINDTTVETYYPAVITKDEFNYVTALRTSRRSTVRSGSRKGQAVSNLFSGLLKCGYCGSSMNMSGYVETRYGAHKRRKYLICNGARTGATKCRCVQWDYNQFEEAFLIRARRLDVARVMGIKNDAEVKALEEKGAGIQSQIADVQKRLGNLAKALEEDPVPGLVKRYRAMEEEKADLELQYKECERLTNVERTRERHATKQSRLLFQLFKDQKTKSDDEKRVMREALSEQIRAIVDRIDVFPTGPILSTRKDSTELRYFNVHFHSGEVVEMS